jgi:phosphate acyltransferase
MRIGVDLMGSDRSPEVIYKAAEQVAAETEHRLVLLGTESVLAEAASFADVVPCEQEILMEDPPLLAVRRKRKSSMLTGIRLLKEGKLDALVSSGNTGAMIAGATLLLKLLPGVERPALLANLPTISHPVACIDVGANVDAPPEFLCQWARMGAAYQRCRLDIEKPRVGLLNIGSEALKGNKETREVFQMLKNADLEFVGNIEGRDVFHGVVDVLVSDGFVGNVFLKTAEGISSFILDYLGKAFEHTSAPEVQRALTELNRQVNYAEQPGALVCGVNGVLIKCHGFSSQRAFYNGIWGAIHLAENGLITRISETLKTA